ncbi:MAG: NAD(P)-dependent oxidoreductase [Terrimesophilobacter sp.]
MPTLKKTVLLTGATGSMGSATLTELRHRRDRFNIVILAHDNKHGRSFLRPFLTEPGIRVVWGDLRDYGKVLDCVTGADIVLHIAALISPAADRDPVATEQINVGSIRNILRAIAEQPDPDRVRLVTVGSVAMTGSRLPPLHWGRVGDPVAPAIGDHYAVSKIESERLVIESGLARWVSLRQTFICIPKLLSLLHPILFHQPVNTQFEFVTARDSGRLMANVCEDTVPDEFWRHAYNIGGGAACRVNYVEYLDRIFGVLGLGALARLTERRWFALKNFHCQWFLDSDVLEDYLHFRRDGLDEYVAHVAATAPWYLRLGLGRLVPRVLIRNLVMKRLARRPEGPLHWIEADDHAKVEAFFGSRQEWERIPGWEHPIPEPTAPMPLDHGYDDSLPDAGIGLLEAASAARFRGGECLSHGMVTGDLYTPLRWSCAAGHEFEATPYLVLRAGHWCRECQPPPWNDVARAAGNHFLAQVVAERTPGVAN